MGMPVMLGQGFCDQTGTEAYGTKCRKTKGWSGNGDQGYAYFLAAHRIFTVPAGSPTFLCTKLTDKTLEMW